MTRVRTTARRMAAILLLAGAFGALSAALPPRQARPGVTDEEQLRALNAEYVASFVQSDPAHYDRLLAPDFHAITPGGKVLDRAAFLAAAAGPSGVTAFEAVDVAVMVIGDVGIIEARTPYTRADGNTGESRYTDIWVRRQGAWKALRAQVTPVR